MPDQSLARTFLSAGADYDRYRPGFPAQAAELVVAAVAGGDARVGVALDLGAGTGKFTELLVSRANRVIAIDPSEQMLAELRRKLPEVDARAGAAEDIPLPDHSVDLVTVAQAFHWFDREAACSQIARVLRTGGALALIWNVSGRECPWDYACGVVAHLGDGDAASDGVEPDDSGDLQPPDVPGFTFVEGRRLLWDEPIARADYLRRWMTVSTMLAATAAEREAALARMADILDTDPATAGRDVLPLVDVTEVFTFRVA